MQSKVASPHGEFEVRLCIAEVQSLLEFRGSWASCVFLYNDAACFLSLQALFVYCDALSKQSLHFRSTRTATERSPTTVNAKEKGPWIHALLCILLQGLYYIMTDCSAGTVNPWYRCSQVIWLMASTWSLFVYTTSSMLLLVCTNDIYMHKNIYTIHVSLISTSLCI